MDCPHPNLNQVSFDTQKVLHKWAHTSETPVTRGEGKNTLGLLSGPFLGPQWGLEAKGYSEIGVGMRPHGDINSSLVGPVFVCNYLLVEYIEPSSVSLFGTGACALPRLCLFIINKI